jgi:uncharacterized protein YcsI (UPF0317 family)
MQVMTSAADVRAAARRGAWCGTTGGHCPAYQQANLVILPQEAAVEFAAFCTRNPTPCPLIEITPPGDPEPAHAAPGADLRTELSTAIEMYTSMDMAFWLPQTEAALAQVERQ